MSKKKQLDHRVVKLPKVELQEGETVKIINQVSLLRGKTGVIIGRKPQCDDGKVKAWSVQLDKTVEIFWDDDLKRT